MSEMKREKGWILEGHEYGGGVSGVINTAPWQPPPYGEREVKIMRVEKWTRTNDEPR